MIRIGKVLGTAIGTTILLYLAALGHFYWTWQVPHERLPEAWADAGEQVSYESGYEGLLANLDGLSKAKLQEWSAPSVSVAVAIDGKLVWAGTHGYADIERRVPATVHSQYRVGSISKSLTSMAMARLVETGTLDLDRPVHDYLPDYPRSNTPITSRLLASHRAGIRHYRNSILRWPPNDFYLDRQFDTVSDALEVFEYDDLLFDPGTDFRYSSYGYNLLSAVLEAASGMDYLTLMRNEVFSPAGMKATQPDRKDASMPDRVSFYVSGQGKYGPAYPVNLSVKWASGGFLSTPSDLVRAGLTVLDEAYLSDASRQLLFTPVARAPGGKDPDGYALGWYSRVRDDLSPDEKGIRVISHSGGSVGGHSQLTILADLEIVIAAQTNTSGGGPNGPKLKAFTDELAVTILAYRNRADKQQSASK
ncbi:MAG: serine hydrolase domain-containing protein [Woeseiaceae bacterium]